MSFWFQLGTDSALRELLFKPKPSPSSPHAFVRRYRLLDLQPSPHDYALSKQPFELQPLTFLHHDPAYGVVHQGSPPPAETEQFFGLTFQIGTLAKSCWTKTTTEKASITLRHVFIESSSSWTFELVETRKSSPPICHYTRNRPELDNDLSFTRCCKQYLPNNTREKNIFLFEPTPLRCHNNQLRRRIT